MSSKLIIWGASGHARVVAEIIRLRGDHAIAGFLDDVRPQCAGEDFEGSTILGGRKILSSILAEGITNLIVAIGDCDARMEAAEFATTLGFTLVSAIHPTAVIAADAQIGAGTVIAATAVVNPACRLGQNVVVNTAATIDHDCEIGDGAHLSPGVRLGGKVMIGRGVWVGIGAVVVDGHRIEERAIIGAGAVVVRDVPAGVVAYGVPARVMRNRN